MKANHQTHIEESVNAIIVIGKNIRSILADPMRNIPVTADELRQRVSKRAINYVKENGLHRRYKANYWTYATVERPSLLLIPVLCFKKVLIPSFLRGRILKKFNSNHPGTK